MNFTEFDVLIFRTMKKKCSSRVKYHWCVQVQTWSLCCVYILCGCSCYRHLLYITNTRRNDTMLYVQIIYSPIIFAYFSHKRVQTRKRNSEEKRRSLWWWSIYKYIYDWNYNRFNRQIYIQNFLRKKEREKEREPGFILACKSPCASYKIHMYILHIYNLVVITFAHPYANLI